MEETVRLWDSMRESWKKVNALGRARKSVARAPDLGVALRVQARLRTLRAHQIRRAHPFHQVHRYRRAHRIRQVHPVRDLAHCLVLRRVPLRVQLQARPLHLPVWCWRWG